MTVCAFVFNQVVIGDPGNQLQKDSVTGNTSRNSSLVPSNIMRFGLLVICPDVARLSVFLFSCL